jgi:hypothetical protein
MPDIVERITQQRLHGALQHDSSEVAWIHDVELYSVYPPTGIDVYKGSITHREL